MRKIAMLHSVTALAVGFANKPAAERTAPVIGEVISGIALPEPVRKGGRGTPSIYPFDSLTEVGQFFPVMNKDKRAMSSVVSNQNKKYKVQATDEGGQPLFQMNEMKGPDGSVTKVADTSKPIMTFTRKFEAREVTPEIAKLLKGKADGAKVLIVRTI
jgi:hypothetical protein